MAMRLKKEIKKSSYYVWFLGAKEARGVRGVHHIRPVVECLEAREKDVEPFKVTLQVSAKGLKIVQNVGGAGGGTGGGGGGIASGTKKAKNETVKHFIPHNTIACVHQQDDIVACILLLFNPVTKCPLHVHAYRCDSLETAAVLKGQLQHFVDRPDNQKKFAEIEARLMPVRGERKELQQQRQVDSAMGSCGTGTTSSKSESSDDRLSPGETTNHTPTMAATTLYDSVAAELRAKLSRRQQHDDVPILLPPRDYDTVHRQRGNLTGIEMRRCLNANIVGQHVAVAQRRITASSGGSSGIGSDHAPSPEALDYGQSTSDEDWHADQDTSPYLVVESRPIMERHHHQQRRPPDPSSPRERFNDAKEKFLSLEKRTSSEYIRNASRSSGRYFDAPTPAPRSTGMRYRDPAAGLAKCDPKRRSMFDLSSTEPEREPFRYAHEAPICKELKRRSLMAFDEERQWAHHAGQGPAASRSRVPVDHKNPARFRNSFVEPREMDTAVADGPEPLSPFTHHHRRFDVLQRTNSTLSNNGRVGIASVHPY